MDRALRIARCFFSQGGTPRARDADLRGRVALVTGGASGIGLETSKGLAARGCDVLVASRCAADSAGLHAVRAAAASARQEVVALPLDLAEPASAAACAREAVRWLGGRPLDLLVCNAGAQMARYSTNEQGVERTWAVNVLGHAALFFGLVDALRKADAPRVVHVAAELHVFAEEPVDSHRIEPSTFSGFGSYCNTKAANILFAREVHRRFPAITSVALHPGVVDSNLAMETAPGKLVAGVKRALLLDLVRGADTTLRCCVEPLQPDGPPLYFVNTRVLPIEPYPIATNEQTAARLYDLLEKLVSEALPRES